MNYNIVTRDHVSDYDTKHDVRLAAMLNFYRSPKSKKGPGITVHYHQTAQVIPGILLNNQLTNLISASII